MFEREVVLDDDDDVAAAAAAAIAPRYRLCTKTNCYPAGDE